MIATKPLFEVGEVVVRRGGKSYPEYDGEYTVIGIISRAEIQRLHPRMIGLTDQWYYELEGFSVNAISALTGLPTGDIVRHSSEKYLFKKHQPGEFDFMHLMAHLKSCEPVVRSVPA